MSIEQLSNLIKKLREEQIYVNSEKKHLVELHKQLLKKAEQLFRKTWIISYQRILLDDLDYARVSTNNAANLKLTLNQYCLKYTNLNKKTNFLESYKVLSYNDYKISEFLKHLKDNPKYLATFLVKCERLSANDSSLNVQQLIPIVFSSLYANGLLINDEMSVLQLLKQLIEIQFTDTNIDLRRLIRKQSCSFNIVFKYYTEYVFSTRLFLTAALHGPILQLLMQDEWYYDVDPEKALVRFSPEERERRFGKPDSKNYKIELQKHREFIVNRLYTFTMAFIDSINSNLFCFPSSLGWLVSHIYNLLNKPTSGKTPQQQQHEARKLCCDLIMALYICPAICDPEPYGVISDIPISIYARHNLMQIANILQVLAMYDDKEAKTQDLYSKFRNANSSDSNCVSDILNTIIISNSHENYKFYLNTTSSPSAATSASSLSLQSSTLAYAPSNLGNNLVIRTSMMVTLQDINKLILFVHNVSKELDKESEEYKWVKNILPTEYLNTLFDAQHQQKSLMDLSSSQLDSFQSSPSTKSKQHSKKKSSIDASVLLNASSEASADGSSDLANFLESLKVLIVSINDKSFDCPGMLSEEKVLQEYEYMSATTPSSLLKKQKSKRKQLLLLDDRSSSDKLENNQSLSSSNDDDDDVDDVMNRNDDDQDDDDDENEMLNDACQDAADGLSEFNFSGRDTPIISGRDTPSSYSHEDARRNSSNMASQINNNSNVMNNNNNNNNNNNYMANNSISRLPVTVHKQNREDINEKFCKFEINKNVNAPVKEEQLSEAWSLDADPPDSVINEPINDHSTEDNLSAFLSGATRPSAQQQQQQQQTPLIRVDNSQFPTSNRAESITSDVCSELESAISSDDRYLNNNNYSDNEQQPIIIFEHSQPRHSNNPLSSLIDAISNKIDEKFNISLPPISTCTVATPTTTTQTVASKNKNPFTSIFTNSSSSSSAAKPQAQQQQQQQQPQSKASSSSSIQTTPTSTGTPQSAKKRFGGIFGGKKSSSGSRTALEQQLADSNEEAAAAVAAATATQDADNILKKYANKQQQQSVIESPPQPELLIQIDEAKAISALSPPAVDLPQFYDSANFEQCKAFQDAKKKLRIVLSWCDVNTLHSSFKAVNYLGSSNKDNFLTRFIKAQLYEAISLQDTEKEAHLDETMRCIERFSELECNKLLKSLKGDYKRRVYYIMYLTKSKQNLLYSNSFLDKLLQRTDSQHRLCIYHFTSVVTRLYLETKEHEILVFIKRFKLLVALDEKFDLYKEFLKQLNVDFDQIWKMCTKEEVDYAHLFIERLLMSRVYTYAMFPNGEIDHHRDRLTFECLQNLGNIITPSHPLIAIPSLYHNEEPWNAAQVELKRINAYKTPQDKLNCIRKCMDAIQNLLAIAKAPVCADDIQPVLTYVIIKANPPGFLSTVQYIEGFYGKQLDQEFYWSQFFFAFSYIKAKLLKNE